MISNQDLEKIGLHIPKILLPKLGLSLEKWAVVACDQYTAEPEYWQEVEQIVGTDPSTLRLIYPEVYLKESKADKESRIKKINRTMNEYQDEKIWVEHEGLVYLERTTHGKTRQGLMVALDLENYDYSKGSQTLIRASEGTIVDRLPPRIKIRENAPVELPHIMVLIDDPQKKVIEPLMTSQKTLVYDFNLMMKGGQLKGYTLSKDLEEKIVKELTGLTDLAQYREKYQLSSAISDILLYAMGDGNHSLATAKAIWEQTKKEKGMDHPSRYALVELVNLHSDALEFEPIHRILFGVSFDIVGAMKKFYNDQLKIVEVQKEEMIKIVKASTFQVFGLLFDNHYFTVEFTNPPTNLTVGSLQQWLDSIVKANQVEEIDYVHGTDATVQIGMQTGNAGFFLPVLKKEELFPTVILDGALPRKTFSMGEAEEKRFYLEVRKIQ